MFAKNYKALVDDQTDFYSQSGYSVPKEVLRQGGATAKTTTAPAVGAQGFTYLGKE
jgi:hypothetical protein